MGLRFQRRIRLFPGVRLNLPKSGIGVSVGTRGAHIGITARGQRYTSVGILRQRAILLPRAGARWLVGSALQEQRRRGQYRSRECAFNYQLL